MLPPKMMIASGALLAASLIAASAAQAQTTWYVNDDGDPDNGCTSWLDACPELQTALSLASAGDQIWVAEGTYRPDYDVKTGQHTGDREASFQLISGVGLYGGFDGTEEEFEDRPGLFDQTILSGDLAENDLDEGFPDGVTFRENSCHVTRVSAVDASTILDGFMIKGGIADASVCAEASGGGMVNDKGAPKLGNLTFTRNATIFVELGSVHETGGGGMWNTGNPELLNCSFSGNTSIIVTSGGLTEIGGGGMWNSGNPELTACSFTNNNFHLEVNGGSLMNYGGGALWSTGVFSCEGCTFDGNSVTGGFFVKGGAIRNVGAMDLHGCVIASNTAFGQQAGSGEGGGVYNTGDSVTFTDCDFVGNASVRGAGMWNSSAFEFVNCTFQSNVSSGAGCGFFNSGDGQMTDCLFADNHGQGIGGGMWNSGNSVLRSCKFIENSAFGSGGFHNYGDPLLVDCSFIGNIAWGVSTGNLGRGGAVRTQGFPTFVNCLFSGNQAVDWGGAIVNSQGATLINCTMTGNIAKEVGGMYGLSSDQSTLANCILWGNTGVQFFTKGRTSITYSDIEGGYVGLGNIDTDPLLIDPDGPDNVPGNEDDNLRLQPGSPCIDAADSTAVPPDGSDLDDDGDTDEPIPFDFDGNARFVDDPETTDTGLGECSIVDMGAYEFQKGTTCCPADFDGDGAVGAADLAVLLGGWGPCEGCPADLDGNGQVGPFDLALLLGNWGPCP